MGGGGGETHADDRADGKKNNNIRDESWKGLYLKQFWGSNGHSE